MPYFMDHENKIMGQFSPFVIVEAIYMVWFTVEFIIRATCCPSKISFAKKSMNWIDLLGRYLDILSVFSKQLIILEELFNLMSTYVEWTCKYQNTCV